MPTLRFHPQYPILMPAFPRSVGSVEPTGRRSSAFQVWVMVPSAVMRISLPETGSTPYDGTAQIAFIDWPSLYRTTGRFALVSAACSLNEASELEIRRIRFLL